MSQAGLTGEQARLLQADENEGCSEDICAGSSGAKRLGMVGVGSASKRRALADLGNVPQPVGQRKADKGCVPPQVGPFPLANTIWSSNAPSTAHPTGLLQPREGSLWGMDSPLFLSPPPVAGGVSSDVNVIGAGDETSLEYAAETFDYLRSAEMHFRPLASYMSRQPDLTHSMRSILVDWLQEVSEEYHLTLDTLALAIAYLDRFLSKMSVSRSKLQLLGATCMYLAAKFEEIYPPEIAEFVYITDDTYTKRQVVQMEQVVLHELEWKLVCPTCATFLPWLIKAAHSDRECELLANYLCELSMVSGDAFLKYLPSEIAVSAVRLALHTLGQPSWSPALELCSGHSREEVECCTRDLHRAFCAAPNHPQKATHDKYLRDKYMRVSSQRPPMTLPP